MSLHKKTLIYALILAQHHRTGHIQGHAVQGGKWHMGRGKEGEEIWWGLKINAMKMLAVVWLCKPVLSMLMLLLLGDLQLPWSHIAMEKAEVFHLLFLLPTSSSCCFCLCRHHPLLLLLHLSPPLLFLTYLVIDIVSVFLFVTLPQLIMAYNNPQRVLLEKAMATHSSILVWRIPWTAEPGELQSMGSQRVRRD